jgi:hypothetical protein
MASRDRRVASISTGPDHALMIVVDGQQVGIRAFDGDRLVEIPLTSKQWRKLIAVALEALLPDGGK